MLEDMDHILDNILSGALMWMQPIQLEQVAQQVQKPEVNKLLDKFQDIFQEPTNLPPKRDCNHAINLESRAPVINQRCYRMPHQQKMHLRKSSKSLLPWDYQTNQ